MTRIRTGAAIGAVGARGGEEALYDVPRPVSAGNPARERGTERFEVGRCPARKTAAEGEDLPVGLGVQKGGAGEEREGVGDGGGEEVGDGAVVPADREDLGFEAAAFADGAGDEDVGEELHLDAFVAEALAVVAAALAGVEGKGGGEVASKQNFERGGSRIQGRKNLS